MAVASMQATHPAPSLQKALSQHFRADQVAKGKKASDTVGRLWDKGFSIRHARDSWARIRPAILYVVQRAFDDSQAAALVYYNTCRMSAGLGPLPASVRVTPVTLDSEHAGKVVDSCGLGMFLHFVKGGAQMMDAYSMAKTKLMSAIGDLVLSGGRDWLWNAATADPKSNGVRRVPGGTCGYCENMAAMGCDVDKTSYGWHDYCECTSEPAFGTDAGPSPSIPDSDVSTAPASEAADVTESAEDVTSAAATPEPAAPSVDDIGPLGNLVSKMSGKPEVQADVIKSLGAIPRDIQDSLVDTGMIRDIKLTNRMPGFDKSTLGTYNRSTNELMARPDREAGDTILHEAMHAYDAMKGSMSRNSSSGWFSITSRLRKAFPKMMDHYTPLGHVGAGARGDADAEMFAELSMQRLQGKAYSLGPGANLDAEQTDMVNKALAKMGVDPK
jgi:hypothetical protein